ncbi:hypothetical protein DPMN_185167 [Dreissena polymorpha]|uniref:Uncharacterized protein n=1 Tax=Dreissena polymorpha TaxID=45954 RepID=A0A9D4I730_DREPO|nr:hypothetical protein DPMN_185167 [Dreissena polymorpha]
MWIHGYQSIDQLSHTQAPDRLLQTRDSRNGSGHQTRLKDQTCTVSSLKSDQETHKCGLQDKRGALHSPVGSPGSLTLKRSQHLNRSLAFP